jgi:hypothetical protein
MKTLLANLRHAARNGETVTVGGGEFTPAELAAFVVNCGALITAAETALEALQWTHGGEPLPTKEAEAIAALKIALRGAR